MLSASYGTEDREIFSVVGGQAAAAGGNDTRTESGRALRRGEAGDAAFTATASMLPTQAFG